MIVQDYEDIVLSQRYSPVYIQSIFNTKILHYIKLFDFLKKRSNDRYFVYSQLLLLSFTPTERRSTTHFTALHSTFMVRMIPQRGAWRDRSSTNRLHLAMQVLQRLFRPSGSLHGGMETKIGSNELSEAGSILKCVSIKAAAASDSLLLFQMVVSDLPSNPLYILTCISMSQYIFLTSLRNL